MTDELLFKTILDIIVRNDAFNRVILAKMIVAGIRDAESVERYNAKNEKENEIK